jgi:hypothetical protein
MGIIYLTDGNKDTIELAYLFEQFFCERSSRNSSDRNGFIPYRRDSVLLVNSSTKFEDSCLRQLNEQLNLCERKLLSPIRFARTLESVAALNNKRIIVSSSPELQNALVEIFRSYGEFQVSGYENLYAFFCKAYDISEIDLGNIFRRNLVTFRTISGSYTEEELFG